MANFFGTNYFKYIIIHLLFGGIINFSAKSQEIHTLKRQLSILKADSSQIRLLYEIGMKYEYSNVDSSIIFLKKSLVLAQKENDSKSVARAMYRIGFMYLYYIKNESNAASWLNKGLSIAKVNNDYENISLCFTLLGIISEHQHTGGELDFYLKALNFAKKTNNWKVLNTSYEILTSYYILEKEYSKAISVIVSSLELTKKHDFDTWFSLGLDYSDILEKQGKFDESLAFCKKLETSKKSLGKSKGDFVYLNDLGRLETKLKNFSEAESIFHKVLAIEKNKPKIDSFHLYFIYNNLETLYLQQADYKKAWQASNNLAETRLWLQEKRQNQDSKLQMTQLKANLDLEKKEIEITLLEAQKQQQLIFLIAIILFVLLLISFLIFLQKNNRKIEIQKTELGLLNSNKDKIFAILSHDLRSPVASLKNYLMLLNWGALAQNEFATAANELSSKVSNIHNMLENLLNWSLSQMGGLKPHITKTLIYDIIDEQIYLLKHLAESKKILIENQIPKGAQVFIDDNHLMIIIRNLLQNAIKFTKIGGNINLTFFENENQCIISIKDDGVGINNQKIHDLFNLKNNKSSLGTSQEYGTGLGLVLIKELVEINSGKIRVESEHEKGTLIQIILTKNQ